MCVKFSCLPDVGYLCACYDFTFLCCILPEPLYPRLGYAEIYTVCKSDLHSV